MKKTLSILLALTMMFSLVACTSQQDQEEAPPVLEEAEDTNLDTETETETDTETEGDVEAEADTQEPELVPPAPGLGPDDTAVPETAPATPEVTAPATPEVTAPATPEPELVPPAQGLGPDDANGADMGEAGDVAPSVSSEIADGFFAAVLAAYPEFPAQMKVEGEFLSMTYPGLADVVSDCGVYMPMISAVASELAIVKTSDIAAVEAIFQARIDYQIAQGAFYPATVAAWQNNVQIVTAGEYAMLVVCPEEAPEMTQAIVTLFTETFA